MATIIYIHGRGLKPAPECERGNWLKALNRGLARLGGSAPTIPDDEHFQLAYWSDLFYPGAPVPDCVDSAQAAPPIVPLSIASLTANQLRALEAFISQFWDWQLRPGDSPDGSTRAFEDGFVRDVVKFFGLGYGRTCLQPLIQKLAAADEDVMLVSHSFGTVLAYEVLSSYMGEVAALRGDRPLHIDTWVTMGSPLGWAIDLQAHIPEWKEVLFAQIDQRVRADLSDVRDEIGRIGATVRGIFGAAPAPTVAAGADGALTPEAVRLPPKEFPANLGRWFNIYDPRDPVACAGGVGGQASLALGETFLYNDAVQGPVQRAFDNTIRNEACPPDVKGVSLDAHNDFQGYGLCAQLAQLVADFWNRYNQVPQGAANVAATTV
jgi:hypothetical protein